MLVSDSHMTYHDLTAMVFSVNVNLTSQPISERLRKAVFRDLRSENLMFAFIKMQNK